MNWVLMKAKERTSFLVLPGVKLLAKTGIHPIALTISSFVTGIFAVYFIDQRRLFILFGILSLVLDILDGNLARLVKKETEVGKWADYGSDRIIEALLIIAAPVKEILIGGALGLFLVGQLIFLFSKRASFFARSWLMIVFMFGLFEVGVGGAIIIYLLSGMWQGYAIVVKKKE